MGRPDHGGGTRDRARRAADGGVMMGGDTTTRKPLSSRVWELAPIASYASAKAVATDAGVAPREYSSGTSVRRRPRMSKQGKAPVRAGLYMSALTVMRHCPGCRAFVDKLTQRGKAKKVIIGAVMRKLLHTIYGVLKHRTPYDPVKAWGETTPQGNI